MSSTARRRPAHRHSTALCVIAVLLTLAACSPLGGAPPPLAVPPTNIITPQVSVLDLTATPSATAEAAPGEPAAATATSALVPPARPAPPAFGGTAAPVPTVAPPSATVSPDVTPEGPPTAPPPSPGAPQVAKVTRDGCCPEPQWLADGSGIIFYGTPRTGDNRRGTWMVPRAGGSPQFVSGLFGDFSADRTMVAYPDGTVARVARLDGAQIATAASDGRRAFVAPTNDRVAWLTPAGDVPQVFAALDPPMRVAVLRFGGAPVVLPPVIRAETLQWFPDGRRILLNGRDGAGDHPGLFVLNTETGSIAQVVTGGGVEMPLVAPNGRLIAYTATLRPEPEANGVIVVNADGSNPRRLPIAGGYRWTPDSGALLYIPAPSDRPTDELWRYSLADGARVPLVSIEQIPFAVMQDEWELAPDGTAIAYRSAIDGAIWVLRFTP